MDALLTRIVATFQDVDILRPKTDTYLLNTLIFLYLSCPYCPRFTLFTEKKEDTKPIMLYRL
jgi:hypothetical protein